MTTTEAKRNARRNLARQTGNHNLKPYLTRNGHVKSCPVYKALGSTPVACQHGYDLCPTCDPCNCRTDKGANIPLHYIRGK
jgi:hypothetical protein